MKVFISSAIAGMEEFRQAARRAVSSFLGYQPIMAEDLTAQPTSSQIACLRGVRQADVFVLILGDRYGDVQASGLSATHEEYREARSAKPVFAFIQEHVEREGRLRDFAAEVQKWDTGVFRGGFSTPEELRSFVTQALHKYDVDKAATPVDREALIAKALSLLPDEERSYSRSSASLAVSVVGGLTIEILRPSELEAPAFAKDLQKEATFGPHKILDSSEGVHRKLLDSTLILSQDSGAKFSIDEMGSFVLTEPLNGDQSTRSFLPVLIEEDVFDRLTACIGFCSWVLDFVDSSQRLNHLAVAVQILGGEILTWRTREEHRSSPNQVSIRPASEHEAVTIFSSRAAITQDADRVIEDLVVRLRRHWKSNR